MFERPATAFVARFMGDHNVVSGKVTGYADGMVDVRRAGRRLRSSRAATSARPARLSTSASAPTACGSARPAIKGLGFTGIVSNIEYQGSSVKLSVTGAGIEDFTAIVDEAGFFEKPVAVGDAVPLHWDAEDAVVLGRLDS